MTRAVLRALAVAAAALLAGAPAARADVGPSVVARADLSLWHEPLSTRAGFDKASRGAILVYVGVLDEMHRMSDGDMLAAFGIKSVNRASTEKWLKKELALSAANYQRAAAGCAAGDWTCLPAGAPGDIVAAAAAWNRTVAPEFAPWRDNLAGFAHAYAGEQLRLAALFPKISSEIDTFNEREWNGDALPDTVFQLSFDDGPTLPGGTTDDTLRMLEAAHRHAVFFMLGGNLQKRVEKTDAATLAALYRNQCVASHGWEHQSHAKWDQWQDSVRRTQALLDATFPKDVVLPYFRPPYGQRRADSGPFFQEQGLQIALWNLDSQDWNAHVTAPDIIDRMTTLALIKRHGVMLFHDVHPKAKVALPAIFEKLGGAVEWRDCHVPMR
jgi:peptidoglycan/xylan/chitin deacetylase (PgdA/CDA1 family)